MPTLSPDQQFDEVKKAVASAIEKQFPVESRTSSLEVRNVEVRDTKSSDDVGEQQKALRAGSSWTVPVYGDVILRRGGKQVDKKRMKLMNLPKMTSRFGYIVDGNEYQILNQFRLKSGVYHRRAPNGNYLAEYNLANPDQFANGRSFKVRLDPKDAVFYLDHRNSSVPIYHLLKGVGISDADLEKKWGKEILEKNKVRTTAEKAFKALKRAVGDEGAGEGAALMAGLLEKTKLLPETTSKTLGKSFARVDADTLVRSTGRLLGMSRGDDQGDDKQALEFQSIHGAEDLVAGHLSKNTGRVRRKVLNNLTRKRKVRAVLPMDALESTVKSFFSTSLVGQPEQTNPLEMISGQLKTTIMGEQGGIKSSHAVSDEAKLVNPSHLGFLDPIHTPEGEKTGVSLSLPLGSRKKGNDLYSRFYDTKAKRITDVDAGAALRKTVAFPDQYKKVGKSFRPLAKKVKATRDGKVLFVDPKEVDYIIPSPRGLFSVAANLIPFLQNNQGNRAMTAVRQQEQAVPLVSREAPMVQVETDAGNTFEGIVGRYAAHTAPISGVVKKVAKDFISIRGKDGKTKKIQLYRDFALRGNSLYDSEVKVKEGDSVKAGQLLADTTFTKDGDLALGTNLRAAYMPFHGYNFEDGIVISEEASKKLTSLHVHQKSVRKDSDTTLSRKKFLAQYPYAYNKDQVKNVGEDGIVRVGAEVKDGDPLILALRKPTESKLRKQIRLFRRGRPDKFRDGSLAWHSEAPGVVTDVVKRGREVAVYVKTQEAAQLGDKLVGRHGNKGVITRIVPSAEMPFLEDKKGDKKHVDILLNPLGVPGRINLGQILETAAGKIAEKTGKPFRVKNFEPDQDYLESVKKSLKSAGLKDKETLINPKTGKPYSQDVLVGNQYILKLRHQATKKLSARSGSGGAGGHYDINHAPAGGAPHGGQSMGELGLYSLLAHGARENIYEMYSYKTNRNDDLWYAIREGKPIPPPKVPFAFDKFLGYLNAMRVNVKKEGNHLQLMPFTEDQVKKMSAGKLANPGLLVRGKDLKPLKGGLFDPDITGGMEGTRWSHFDLAEPMPNPLFEEAIKKLTGLTRREYQEHINGSVVVNGKRGGAAIGELLKKIDVKKMRGDIEGKIEKSKGAGKKKLHKQLRVLKALDAADLKPTVYMMKSVPVAPPVFRPVTVKEDGSLSNDDLNGLYKDIGALNETLEMNLKSGVPSAQMKDVRAQMYDGLKAMTGMGGSLTREYRGILDILSGKVRKGVGAGEGSAKRGFFQRAVRQRRQDFSARSIITPEPRMGLDELGLPEDIAWTMYQPFIERELIRQNFKPQDAIEAVSSRSVVAQRALDRAMKDRPVLLKRDPALHKFNVMGFKPRLVRGKAIEIHPLVTGGYNADFDGDTMSVYLPITEKAVKESHKLYPSNNLFSPTSGAIMYTPGHEALLGTYLLSKPGKRTKKSYKTLDAAQAAVRKGEIGKTDIIRVAGSETTVGRMLIEKGLPSEFRETGKKPVSKMRVLDKGAVKGILTRVARKYESKYGDVANHLKDLGNEFSTEEGFSIGLEDFAVVNKRLRDRMFSAADRAADKIRKDKTLKESQKESKIVRLFSKVDDRLDALNNRELLKKPTNIFKMVVSGSRGSPLQLKQIVSSPALVQDAKDRTVPYLIPRSYSEGMDVASYWTTMHGARKGTIQKVQGVRDPGYLSKQVINSAMNQLVTEADCGTVDGISISTSDMDAVDRYLARPVKLKGKRYSAGALVTPELLSAAGKAKVGSIPVRSPMRCKASHGVCKKCMGLTEAGKSYDIGTNVGVIAAQSIGEPSSQLALRVFHTGGVAKGTAAKSVSMFGRLSQLLRMPRNLPNQAPLATTSGKVDAVKVAPQGGAYAFINKVPHYLPPDQAVKVRKGKKVARGDALTDGAVDPKQLLVLKGVRAVQDYLTDEIHGVMRTAVPIKRRNVEVVVKAMTDVGRVETPGEHEEWTAGDIRPISQIAAWNRKSRKKKKVEFTPIVKGVDVLPTEVQEDWVARLNFQNLSRTLAQAAREGWRSNIHGFHPIPGIAYSKEFGRSKERLGKDWKGQY